VHTGRGDRMLSNRSSLGKRVHSAHVSSTLDSSRRPGFSRAGRKVPVENGKLRSKVSNLHTKIEQTNIHSEEV
jgi:hypothetical protein